MSDWRAWPALLGASESAGGEIRCEVGVWGKVHRQGSDYRWIARSAGFGLGLPDLARRLRIGAEDRAGHLVAWRAPWETRADLAGEPGGEAGGGAAQESGFDYFALGLYPSRALDAAGRSAVLEKRVLQWRAGGSDCPAALAALALLPSLGGADDGLWWGRLDEGDWGRPHYALPLAADACPRLSLDAAGIERAIASGIEALAAVLDPERLGAVFAGLLAGERPALLHGLAEPLPPAALAVLLLPLPPGLAARCSLAAWLPAARLEPEDLGRDWDLVCVPQAGPGPGLGRARLEQGMLLAEALLEGEPGRLAPGTARLADGGAAIRREPEGRVIGGGVGLEAGPGLEPGHRSPHLSPVPVPVPVPVPSDADADADLCPRLHLRPAGRPGLGYLHRFADRIALRRLDLARLREDFDAPGAYPALAPEEAPDGHPLLGWLDALEARVPDGADPQDWAFKTDQLRAAALFLLPHQRTLELVGLPEDPRVPALLAVLAADPGPSVAALAAHGAQSLGLMVKHSLDCPDPSLAAEIRRWMDRWALTRG